MARSRLVVGILVFSVSGLAMQLPSTQAQNPPEPDKARDEAIQWIQRFLVAQQINTKVFAEPMPFSRFLDVLMQQLPDDKTISFRIDRQGFADKYAELAATSIVLPQSTNPMSLNSVLQAASKQIKIKHDYRLGAAQYVFTTPERALYTAAYDIRDILAKPETVGTIVPFGTLTAPSWNAFQANFEGRNRDAAYKSARVVQALVAAIDGLSGEPAPFERASIQVLNGTRLVIRTNSEKHAEVAALLAAFRRFGDLWVTVNTQLYEVDDAFYAKLKNAKPIDWEEAEKILLGQLPAKTSKGPSFFNLLAKQKPVQSGNDVKVDAGLIATLLSRHHAVCPLPNRDQVIRQDKSRTAILEGVAFVAGIHVSSDRRYVRVQLTEKATEIHQIKRVKVLVAADPDKEVIAEIPFTKEATHMREFEVADGGTILIPVHYRPKSLEEKNRWWILKINPRIWIEEEEEQIRIGALADILPLLVADVLKNPRLKATRDFYGTAGDQRFALIDSAAWKWDKETTIDVPGAQRTPATRNGQRLLGIRIDRFHQAEKVGDTATLTVTLLNAGGSDNGSVIGNGTIRYRACHTEQGWSAQLLD